MLRMNSKGCKTHAGTNNTSNDACKRYATWNTQANCKNKKMKYYYEQNKNKGTLRLRNIMFSGDGREGPVRWPAASWALATESDLILVAGWQLAGHWRQSRI